MHRAINPSYLQIFHVCLVGRNLFAMCAWCSVCIYINGELQLFLPIIYPFRLIIGTQVKVRRMIEIFSFLSEIEYSFL